MRGSILRQVDKKSRVPEEEKVVCSSRGGERDPESLRRRKGSEAPKEEKGANIFFLHCFSLVNITVYLARGYVSLNKNLLADLVFLKLVNCGSGSGKTFTVLRHSFDFL